MRHKIKKILILVLVLTFISTPTITSLNAVSYNDWTIINGVKYFYNSLGQQIGTANAKKVIDVSEHQGVINWNAVKNQNTGAKSIDGAIIRLSAGTAREDYQLANNIRGARANGIPIGAYIYSYANCEEHAIEEARFTVEMIEKYGLQNTEFPIYYDLERFTAWSDGTKLNYAPSSSAQYERIVKTYMNYLNSRGYYNIQLYSYRSLIQSHMNTPYLLKYLGWIAEYSHVLNFDNTYYNGLFGWQYTSTLERVNGINGNVDVSCFYNKGTVDPTPKPEPKPEPEEPIEVPNDIKNLIESEGLANQNNLLTGFLPSSTNQSSNLQKIQNLNNEEFEAKLEDGEGKLIDINSNLKLATGYRMIIKRKTDDYQIEFAIVVKSDINGNGSTDAADYLMVMDKILNRYTMNNAQLKAGDINGNGMIDAADYLMIMDNILGRYTIS